MKHRCDAMINRAGKIILLSALIKTSFSIVDLRVIADSLTLAPLRALDKRTDGAVDGVNSSFKDARQQKNYQFMSEQI
jgi:hypothetical protein